MKTEVVGQIVGQIAFMFGAMCFLYTLFRNAFGTRHSNTPLDYIAFVGMWFFPLTWIIYGLIMPVAWLVDRSNRKEYEAKYGPTPMDGSCRDDLKEYLEAMAKDLEDKAKRDTDKSP